MLDRPKEITGSRAVVVRSLIAIVIGGMALFMALDFFPRRVAEREGTVISFQNVTSETGAVRTLAVRLDSGVTVRATYDGYVVATPGQRVAVVELESALLGFRRYQFSRHLGPHVGAGMAVTDESPK